MIVSFVLTVAFVSKWYVGVIALLSQLSGWSKLATVYRAQHPPSGRRLAMQGGKIGDVWYTRCLTIYVSHEGFYLSIWPIFRFRQPPLFIPWSAIHNRREKRWLWFRLIEFGVGSPPIGTMRLMPNVFRDVPDV